jgi:His-Xaa-Ser system protein HxsD
MNGFPAELARVETDARSASIRVDSTLYPIDAVYGAAYVFLDRCYVMLDAPEAARIRVTLAWKKGDPTDADLRALVGEFTNELLSCAWRVQIAKESRVLIESATSRAIGGAMGPPSIDDLEKFDFTEESFEDPLGIALSWEEKYGKKKPAEGA